jgi:hypothetical protein
MTMSPEDVTRRLRAELDSVPVPERPWAAVRLGLVRRRARRRRAAAAAAGAAVGVIGLAAALAVVLPGTGPGHRSPSGPVQRTSAQARPLPQGRLISGKPVNVTISSPSQHPRYTFAATAGENVTFNVTHFKFHGGFGLNFYEPGSNSVYLPCYFTGNSYCNFATRVSGVWAVMPAAASAGSLTLAFAGQVPTKALTPGIPVTTTIRFEGQEARYTFAARAGRTVTFKVTQFSLAGNGGPDSKVFLDFYKPGSNPSQPGSSPYTECAVDGNTTCSLSTPVGGTWSITLVNHASVGSLTTDLVAGG